MDGYFVQEKFRHNWHYHLKLKSCRPGQLADWVFLRCDDIMVQQK